MNSTCILARTGLQFLPIFTRSLLVRQVFGAIAGEKFSVDINIRSIDCTLDQFYFIRFFLLINYVIYLLSFVLGIMPYFICVVTWSRLHTCDFRKALSVHAKTRSQGITSIRS